MTRSPFGSECRRHFGSTPTPKLPETVTPPTAEDPATKSARDKSVALAKQQAQAQRGMSATRHVAPTLGMPRTAALLGGGMGPV